MKRVRLALGLAAAAVGMAATLTAPAALANGAKQERFVASASDQPMTHRTNNTAMVASVMPSDKPDGVFAIGLEALKWVGASSRQVGVPYPSLWCADFINFV